MESKTTPQREIKFRAFIKVGDNDQIKLMLEGVSVYGHGSIGYSEDDLMNDVAEQNPGWKWEDGAYFTKGDEQIFGYDFGVFTSDEWAFFEKFHLMQFTGLMDKEGMEIYQGDIVEDDGGRRGSIIWNQSDCSFCVDFPPEFNFHGESLQQLTASDHLEASSFNDWLTVVGNIHTSPELLTEQPLK